MKQRFEILKALKKAAFKKRGRVYAVRHIGTWLAFATALKTLVLGDGNVSPTRVRVAVGEGSAEVLAGAVDGLAHGRYVDLRQAMIRVLPPLLPTLFERDVALFRHLALFVRGLETAVDGRSWLLYRGVGYFRARGAGTTELAEALRSIVGRVVYTNGTLYLSETGATKLVKLGLASLLSETGHTANGLATESSEEAKQDTAKTATEVYALRIAKPPAERRTSVLVATQRIAKELGLSSTEVGALEEVVRLARRVGFGVSPYTKRNGGRMYTYVKEYAYLYYDDERLNKALQTLQRIGYRPAVYRDKTKDNSTETRIRRSAEEDNIKIKTIQAFFHH